MDNQYFEEVLKESCLSGKEKKQQTPKDWLSVFKRLQTFIWLICSYEELREFRATENHRKEQGLKWEEGV